MEELKLVNQRIAIESIPKEKLTYTPQNDSINLSLNDTRKVWSKGIVPDLPDFSGIISSSKQNGSSNTIEQPFLTSREVMKIKVIQGTVNKPDFTYGKLARLGCSSEGFVTDQIRCYLWPRILEIPEEEIRDVEDLENMYKKIPAEVYDQLLRDIARSSGHLSPNATEEETKKFHTEMAQLICWVLQRHPSLNYYQGYHDIAATILLVMGLQKGLYVLERLTLKFLERFMEKTMEKVNQELFFIFALLERQHPFLLEHLENVELFPHFALAEYTTWYAHKYAENRHLLHRLFDYFLGAPPLLPLYLSSAIVVFRDTEIFNTTPDMGHTHKVLCTLPEDLPFEKLLTDAKTLYQQYPPESIVEDVKEYDLRRRRKEQEWVAKAEATRLERERLRQLQVAQRERPQRFPQRIRNVKTFTVITIMAIGLYAYYKSSLTFT